MNLGPGQYALIATGGLLALSGFWLLVSGRSKTKAAPLHIAGSGGSDGISQPTRIVCALVLLIGGYHLVIWAFPTWVSAVQLNRALWYVWSLIGIFGVGASLLMDRFDQQNLSDGGDDRP